MFERICIFIVRTEKDYVLSNCINKRKKKCKEKQPIKTNVEEVEKQLGKAARGPKWGRWTTVRTGFGRVVDAAGSVDDV